ncbi:M48 family metalloprotease [Emcibacter nanhaiensis]|uniref:LysM peptidoglycan-binding domain-containing protein n=1 Tax=Emcibacter nanhaiensis TaxID=1505037 RepID=A0A501PNZ1_9PROT|nr:M48 family metalloprotease [Emcibacter nanhaiensis]TPD61704.1 LysM peptidoglycan-binding domain-containing protein [Emcibacter nanhaiensis]
MALNKITGIVSKWLVGGLMIVSLAGCTTLNPATGQREFTPFMSPSQEASLGAEAHPSVIKEHGGVYDDPNIGGYVATVGGRLAAVSELPELGFTFTVLDSPIVNAFALPGGYIYVTRGILALFNSEAEMASVLGHEIGHVTARHTAKRYNQSVFANILGAGVGVLAGSEEVANLVNYGSQLYLLSYSRDQEYQADSLGVRYTSRAGIDPYGAGHMLDSLKAESDLADLIANRSGSERTPEFFSTHPNTEDRASRAYQLARDTGIAQGSRDSGHDRYLSVIDGMIYGDNPDQGLIRGRIFWHPKMLFTFEVPENYKMSNSSTAVVAQGSGAAEGAAVIFAGGSAEGKSLQQYMNEAWKSISDNGALENWQDMTINGMAGLTATTTGTLSNQPVLVRMVAIRYSATQAYHFLMIMPQNNVAALEPGLKTMAYSFRKLSASEADKVKAKRIKVITVQKGDTAQSLSRHMAFDDYQLERFLTLNGLQKNSTLRVGERLKLIVE